MKQAASRSPPRFFTQNLEIIPLPYLMPEKSFAADEAVGGGGLFAMFRVSPLEGKHVIGSPR